jgi:hypothetical protein
MLGTISSLQDLCRPKEMFSRSQYMQAAAKIRLDPRLRRSMGQHHFEESIPFLPTRYQPAGANASSLVESPTMWAQWSQERRASSSKTR